MKGEMTMDKKYIILILLVLAVLYLVYKSFGLMRTYQAEVQNGFKDQKAGENSILTENDIKDLPLPVQNYLRYSGVMGKEKVKNFRAFGDGEFKTGPDKEWLKSKWEQYNFMENPRRIYFLKITMFGVPVVGLHVYKDTKAMMLIKAAGLLTVGDAKGEIADKAETVTVFNDMCLMAPATLIDKRITWETVNPLQVIATFDNNGIKISAELYFNEKGELTNFISHDRYMTLTGESYQNAPWSTPVKEYKVVNGFKLVSSGEAIWHLPEGDYYYAKINIKDIQYNLP